MNGEMHQICMLVSQARNAMAGKNEFEYMAGGYINSILSALPLRRTSSGKNPGKHTAHGNGMRSASGRASAI